tara:strand:+ start:25750 stop:28245 length:2496 start_codon:yes stop_codon:yes gene_type:complete
MKIKIYKTLLYVLIASVLGVPFSCSEDDNKTDGPNETTECNLIQLEAQSVLPTDKLFVKNIDESLKENLTAEYWYNNIFTGISINVGIDENDKSFIIAPMHPELPLKGGELQVIFKNHTGTIICDPKPLIISQLPKAEGYTEKVVLAFQNLLAQRTEFLNIDETVLSGELTDIEPTDVPFSLLYNLLHNEDAEFALIPFLENDRILTNESVDKATSIDISDRLLNKYGVLDHINQKIKDFETKNSKKTNIKNNKTNESAGCFGLDADDLADQMKAAVNTEYSDPKTITGKYFSDLSNAATAAGFIPQAATAATVVGAIVWGIQKIEEGYSKTRLSHFTKFEFSILNTNFLEETACPEPIIMAQVFAASNDWSIDKSIWESLIQASSFLPTQKAKNLAEEIGFGAASTFTSTQLSNLANLGHWENGILKVPTIECGPIDVLNSKYLKGETQGSAFEVDYKDNGGIEVYPIDTGKDVLELSLRPEVFSGQTKSDSQELNLTPVELKWTHPTTNPYIVKPEDPVNLQLELKNTISFDIDLSTPFEVGVIYGDNYSESPNQNFTILTPADENKYPFTITAEFVAFECFRGTEYAQPITTEIIIDMSKISVYTNDDTCFQVGDFKDFNANVSGDDKKVVWSAKNESGQTVGINDEGGFTAPNNAGKYYITATLESNSEIFDTIEVEVVGSCTCYWNFTGGSYAMSYDQAWYSTQEDLTTGALQLNLHNDFYAIGDEEMIINMYNSFLPQEGETKITTGTNDDNLANNLITIRGLNFPGQSSVIGPLGNYSVTLKWTNQYLEGTITGTLQKSTIEGDTEIPFTLKFGANEGMLSCDN